uniref:Putative VRR-NUC domain-containing protein n=1 Tax=viral metagenome TaxID=1070528 RepID=A0A6H1ZUM5_9ZZZZ
MIKPYKMKRSIKMNKEKNGISFEIKNIKPIRIVEKGNPNEEIKERPYKPKITEADVIRVINDYLQIQRNQGKLMFIRNNSGAMPITDGKNKRRYIRFGGKGSPDFFVFETLWLTQSMKAVEVIAIEAKSETGKLSTDQLKWKADFLKLGGVYYVVRCLEDLVKIIL